MGNNIVTLRQHSLFFILTLATWVVIGLIVINHNIAPLGSITLNWPNPAQPTAHFRWDATPITAGWRGVTLPVGQAQRLSVRLPRGFAAGELVVQQAANENRLLVKTETNVGQSEISRVMDRCRETLAFDWPRLQARGREFSFILTAVDYPVTIKSISVRATR